jgi:hypothetical protein
MTAAAQQLKPTGTDNVVARLPVTVQKNEEAELAREMSAVELQAESYIIATDEDYAEASEFARELKRHEAKVIAFWKDKKDAAFKTHRLLCEDEKKMLAPVVKAIATMKKSMGAFAQAQAEKQRLIEQEARRLAQEEADRKLAEAIKAEETGDTKAAQNAMLDAQMADSMSRNLTVNVATPKAEGISQRADWEIESVDPEIVPSNFNGMELRPVDKAAVMRLIRASKGKIQIPGVVYKEVVSTTIRK